MNTATTQQLEDANLEEQLVSVVMNDPDVIVALKDLVLPDEFSNHNVGVIWEAMLGLLYEKIRPSLQNVLRYLQDKDWQNRAGGIGYVASLKDVALGLGPGAALDAPVWAGRIADFANRRALVRMSGNLTAKAHDMQVDSEELWSEVVSLVAQGKRSGTKFATVSSATGEIGKLIQAWLRGERPDVVPTGLKELDYHLGGGLPRRQLTILGGRPGSGKTMLSAQIAANVEKSGGVVALASLEMALEELVVREVCREAQVDGLKLRRGDYVGDHDVEARLVAALGKVSLRNGTLVQDKSMQKAVDMHYEASMLYLEKGRLDLHMVDYVELMGDVSSEDADSSTLAGVVMAHRRLKALAKSVGCAELVLSQLSRRAELGSKVPKLQDLMYGGEAEADNALLIYWPWKMWKRDASFTAPKTVARDADGNPFKDHLYLCLAKARYGTEVTFALRIRPEYGQIDSFDGYMHVGP